MSIDYSHLEQESSFIFPEAYIKGNTAFTLKESNPYDEGSFEHGDWECGYADAEGYDDFVKGKIV